MFINARDNETMPVMNDEVPDEGDYDAGRGRGEFDNITPEDFIHGGGSGHGNPPGWLGPADINRARHQMPIAYVEIVPVRTDEMGRISQVGSLLRVSEDGSIERTLITGRVLYHETLREAIAAMWPRTWATSPCRCCRSDSSHSPWPNSSPRRD